MAVKKMKYLIIGGVAGGASAATRLRRNDEHAEIIMIERGKEISYANCGMPYYLGGIIENRDRLNVESPAAMKERFNIDVRTATEAIKILPSKHKILIKNLATDKTYYESYDKLLLATGSSAFIPPIPGIDNDGVFAMKTLSDCDNAKKYFDKNKPKHITIMGGGPIGVELAENYQGLGLDVTIIEFSKQILGIYDPEIAKVAADKIEEKGIKIILETSIKSVEVTGKKMLLKLSNNNELETGMLFVVAGVRPVIWLAEENGLKTTDCSAIWVDEYLTTSNKDIFAVGDAIAFRETVTGQVANIALAGPANKQGRLAADNMTGAKKPYNSTNGSSALKCFDLTFASTGISESQALKFGLNPISTTIHSQDHAGYYPGATPLTLKLIFTKNGTILGAQACGLKGVEKRIDVIATAIKSGLKVDGLAALDLCYAPPFSSAKDPVNMVAFTAQNILSGEIRIKYATDISSLDLNDWYILDVRTTNERTIGFIPNSHLIDLDKLRKNIHRLDKNKKYLVYCASGLRSYLACRILSQNGYDVYNLVGGYDTYKSIMPVNTKQKSEVPITKNINEEQRKTIIGHDAKPSIQVDACGLMCPGPLTQVHSNINKIESGQILEVSATDPAFKNDIVSWCHSTGNELVNVNEDEGKITALIQKGATEHVREIDHESGNAKTLVVFSDDIDRVIAAFIIANGAAAMGREVTMFFTFWGLNVLRKPGSVPVKKDIISKAFAMMMPKGSQHLHLSQMNMGGMGTALIRWLMIKKNIGTLESLMDQARAAGVKLLACSTSMDIMGIKQEELYDFVDIGGVATYLGAAEKSDTNLFI